MAQGFTFSTSSGNKSNLPFLEHSWWSCALLQWVTPEYHITLQCVSVLGGALTAVRCIFSCLWSIHYSLFTSFRLLCCKIWIPHYASEMFTQRCNGPWFNCMCEWGFCLEPLTHMHLNMRRLLPLTVLYVSKWTVLGHPICPIADGQSESVVDEGNLALRTDVTRLSCIDCGPQPH